MALPSSYWPRLCVMVLAVKARLGFDRAAGMALTASTITFTTIAARKGSPTLNELPNMQPSIHTYRYMD